MAVSLIPPIGTVGTWILKVPYNADINPEILYTCVAVRRLSEFRLLGIDPYNQYYLGKGISETDYAADSDQGDVCIVSLQSPIGDLVFVPSTYILSYPNPNGHRYTPMVLVVDVGSIPDKLNLNAVKSDISDIVKTYLGLVSADVLSVAVGESIMVTPQDHANIEAARIGRITVTKTLSTRLTEAQIAIAGLTSRNQELENYILANQTP